MRFIFIFFGLIVLTACEQTPLRHIPRPSIPFVHHVPVQQGNVVTQEMVAQLRLGMNKKKVRYVMGTPIIKDTFNASRWDYIYTFQQGGTQAERRLVTAVFNEDGKLIGVEGDVKAALGKLVVDKHQDTSVKVPEDYNRGIMARLKDSMPFTGDDGEKLADKVDEEAEDAAETAAKTAEEKEAEILAEADVDSVTVPEGALPKKKKGFFARIVDSVGLGADEDEDENESSSTGDIDQNDKKYRDPTDPDRL